ncbi:oxidoreductase-like protein [Plenodomus tracheiphilus IPT5]|uniref:Oxidoreductase-like protein n=1 Tax=Plenodomus tracheiphilus IPT5 TaxID=1408161 RepID=A0A6A7AWF5_9PLEO|nr:oxidoreductase-like protein [Plenodomus tracheiphilus IPT5]
MAFSMAKPWHKGEVLMQRLLHVPETDNPTSTILTPQASLMLQRGPLLAIGTLDKQLRPWTTLWGGSAGFSSPLGGNMIGTRTLVDGQYDPVVRALVGNARSGELVQPEGEEKLVSGLAIDLMTRKRVKLAGVMVAGTVTEIEVTVTDDTKQKQSQIQLVTKIKESLGNCPKYLNQYEIRPALVSAEVKHIGPDLSTKAQALISKSDVFFLSTNTPDDMDTNHRGGSPGFVRLISPTQLVYPEYSGNRLYQSLGNLKINPCVGITFPDFETGDILYITGSAEILDGASAASILPGSNLAVQITFDETRLIAGGLPFRGTKKAPSPYNPLVRTLASEGNIKAYISQTAGPRRVARLTKKDSITLSIMRFTFLVDNGIRYEPGQWIAMDFREELNIGYEHMRDDDPRSINDDFIRTFTISSIPKSRHGLEREVEITIRAVGPATRHLFRQNDHAGFEVPILGVGGDFRIQQNGKGVTPFIAGGVGITPLLGQLPYLEISPGRFRLFWTIRLDDVAFVVDVLHRRPELAKCTQLFITGAKPAIDSAREIVTLEDMGVRVERRRPVKTDLDVIEASRWYMCAGKLLRETMLSWLEDQIVLFEDFDY